MPGLFTTGLDVDDEDVVFVDDQEVGLAGEGGGVSAEPEGVLVLDADFIVALEPLVALLVEQGLVAG